MFFGTALIVASLSRVNGTEWHVGGTIGGGGRHDGGVAMVMRVEHARSPLRCPPVAETRRGDEAMRRRGGAVLPAAVGHGVLSLLLLEQLRDGQQLFQHVLQRAKRALEDASVTGRRKDVLCVSRTCCAPLSLLSVRSSSECEAQTSCSAARSRDRSVLKCSVASGRSGTFCRKHGGHFSKPAKLSLRI